VVRSLDTTETLLLSKWKAQLGHPRTGKNDAMFEQTFKNIDDILHKDAGCGSELDYVEQTSWVLFLKYLDDLEKDKATAAELTGKTYTPIIAPEYQWNASGQHQKTKQGWFLKWTTTKP
jgi:type I restriction-modification system DNA methylase subunit